MPSPTVERWLARLTAHLLLFTTFYATLDLSAILNYDVIDPFSILEPQSWSLSFQVLLCEVVAFVFLNMLVSRVVDWALKHHRKRIRKSRPRVIAPPRCRGPRPESPPPSRPVFHDAPVFVPTHPACRLIWDPTPRPYQPPQSPAKPTIAQRRAARAIDMPDMEHTLPGIKRYLPPRKLLTLDPVAHGGGEDLRPTIPLRNRGHATFDTQSSRPATAARHHLLPSTSPFVRPKQEGLFTLPPIAPRRVPPIEAFIPEPISSPRGPARGHKSTQPKPQYSSPARRSPPPPNPKRKPKLGLFTIVPTPHEYSAEVLRARKRKLARTQQAQEQEVDDDERRRRVPAAQPTHDHTATPTKSVAHNTDVVTQLVPRKSTSAVRTPPQQKSKARPYPETKALRSSLTRLSPPRTNERISTWRASLEGQAEAVPDAPVAGPSALAGTKAATAARKLRKAHFDMPGAMPGGENDASGPGSKASDADDTGSVAAELEQRVAKIIKKADKVGKKTRRTDDVGPAPAAAPRQGPTTRSASRRGT